MVTSPVTMSIGQGTIKQAQAADSGDFSQVLGSVNQGSAQKSEASPKKTENAAEGGFKFTQKAAEKAAADSGGGQSNDIPADSLEALAVLETASAMLSSVSAELTLKLEQYSDEEAKDKIIAALLEILKKLKEKQPEEGLSAAELLMSMLSAPSQYSADPQIETLVSELSALLDDAACDVKELSDTVAALADVKDYAKKAEIIKDSIIPEMAKLRKACDKAETLTSEKYWPFPTYSDLLFGVK